MTNPLGGLGASPPERLKEIAARLKAATPGPWVWGPDWATLEYHGPDTFEDTDKYADLALRGGDGKEIIPVRVDHYEPIWDTAHPDEEPNAADRALIAHAPEDIAYLLELVRGVSSPSEEPPK